MPKMKLSEANIDKIKPSEKRQYIHDTGCRGLTLIVHPTGKKTWQVYKTVRSRPHRVTLGEHPFMSVSEARKSAIPVIAKLLSGKSTAKEPPKKIRHIYRFYFENHLSVNAARKTARESMQRVKNHWSPIINEVIQDIEPSKVMNWLNAVAENSGKATANKCLVDLKAAVNYCISLREIKLTENPLDFLKPYNLQGRERYVQQGSEFRRLRAALISEQMAGNDIGDIGFLLLYTLARKGNVLSMEWKEIDFSLNAWFIPAKKAKGRKLIKVALIDQALEILEKRRFLVKDSGFVFPSSRSKSGHKVSVEKDWQRVLKKAGIDDLNIHDLRHTGATNMGKTGASAFAIRDALGHASVKTTEMYTHIDIEPTRAAINEAVRLMEGPPPQ